MRQQLAAANAGDVDPRVLQGVQQGFVRQAKKLIPAPSCRSTSRGLVRRPSARDPGGEVVQRGQVGDIAPVAAKQNVSQIDQAVDRLDRREFPVAGPVRCSTLRWCLKNDTSLAVVSIRSTMPCLSYILIEHLPKRCLMQVPSIRVANCEPISCASDGVICRPKRGDLLGLHVQHRLADQLLIKRAEGDGGAERQIGGVFHLHQAPMIGLPEHIRYRAIQFGIPIQRAVQLVRRQCVGQGLGKRPVGDGVRTHYRPWCSRCPSRTSLRASQLWPLQ